MAGITEFIGTKKKTLEGDIIKRFDKLIEGKDKEGIRETELALLKPKPIPHYKGKKPSRLTDLKRRVVTLYFQDEKILMRFSKFIKIQTYIENNIHDVAIFLELLRLLESQTIKWVEDEKHFTIKQGEITRRIR